MTSDMGAKWPIVNGLRRHWPRRARLILEHRLRKELATELADEAVSELAGAGAGNLLVCAVKPLAPAVMRDA